MVRGSGAAWETLKRTLGVRGGMSESDWTDAIVGERMAVDQQFATEVRDSPFSNQEWGLIMTAAEFEIVDADDPENARIVPDTEKLAGIMPEVEKMERGMGGGPGGSADDGDGVFSSVKDALGVGGDGDGGGEPDRIDEAEELLERYAETLQEHLIEKGRWEQVRIAYQEQAP
jgi:hypothetical protein